MPNRRSCNCAETAGLYKQESKAQHDKNKTVRSSATQNNLLLSEFTTHQPSFSQSLHAAGPDHPRFFWGWGK